MTCLIVLWHPWGSHHFHHRSGPPLSLWGSEAPEGRDCVLLILSVLWVQSRVPGPWSPSPIWRIKGDHLSSTDHRFISPLWDFLTPRCPIVWKDTFFRLRGDCQTSLYGTWHLNIRKSCEINFLQIKMDRWKYLVLFYTCAIYIMTLLIVLHLNSVLPDFRENIVFCFGVWVLPGNTASWLKRELGVECLLVLSFPMLFLNAYQISLENLDFLSAHPVYNCANSIYFIMLYVGEGRWRKNKINGNGKREGSYYFLNHV